MDKYRIYEDDKADALNRGALAEYDRLSTEQKTLGKFRPTMTHSFLDEAKHVIFHSQILSDFSIVDELGRKMLEQLDR